MAFYPETRHLYAGAVDSRGRVRAGLIMQWLDFKVPWILEYAGGTPEDPVFRTPAVGLKDVARVRVSESFPALLAELRDEQTRVG